MRLNRMVFMFAGLFIIVSLVLAHVLGQADLSKPSFLWFTAFVGVNLFQTSFTGFCPLAKILKAFGVKE
ncbi:MAG TPA: DUF2892 domain-containing protein [Oceanospirillales bacterium]|nr:DUF2892 domain-containing protein [Oceanospirillales bacterium]